jgi:hypothetical protein
VSGEASPPRMGEWRGVGRDRPPPDEYGPDEYPTERLPRNGGPVRRTRRYEEERRPPGPPPHGVNPWVWVVALGLVLAAGVIIAIVVVRSNDSSSTVTVTTGSTATTSTTATVTTQPPLSDVPDVGGETQISAVTTVQDAGLVPNTYPVPSSQQRGTVVAQNPSGGQLQEGGAVRLNISTGTTDTPEASVPDVTGPAADDARLTLARAKMCMRTLTRPAPSSDAVGTVLAQSPSAGASVSQFAQVTIYVGT